MTVVPLQHVSVQTISKLLDSFATKPGAIRADPTKNLMFVIGNGLERRTAVDTILSFDEDWMRGQSVGIFPVHNSTPEPLIAGLIQEEHDKTRAGVPLVEQIPFVGEAFTPTNNTTVDRKGLIIFIQPQIIRDGVDASNIAEELRSKMRGDKVGITHPAGAVTPYPIGLVQ